MATKTKKRSKKSKAPMIRAKRSVVVRKPTPNPEGNIFWPDRVDHVKAIAARGLTDDEMAVMMGVSESLLDSWKKFYPEFNKAIEEGRTLPDQQVIEALHRNAVGYTRTTDVVVRGRKGAEVIEAEIYYPGETAAQRYWLNNRQPKNWKERQAHDVQSKSANVHAHVTAESKQHVINSIINLITPQPDK